MIRLVSISLENFKNVESGTASLSSWAPGDRELSCDLVGIYGQNGSGKTSIIKALAILKSAFLGASLQDAVRDCVAKGAPSATISVDGYIFDADCHNAKQYFSYKLAFTEKPNPRVVSESLSYKPLETSSKRVAVKTLFNYVDNAYEDKGAEITPASSWDALIAMDGSFKMTLAVAQRICEEASRSLLLSREMDNLIGKIESLASRDDHELSKRARQAFEGTAQPLRGLLDAFHSFASNDLAIVSASQQAEAMIDHMKISTHQGPLGDCADASFLIDISEPALVADEHMLPLQRTIETISGVLASMVPGLSLGVSDLGAIMLDKGAMGHRVEITSTRGNAVVPLRCESEGIKKLVGILSMLVDVYGKPGACVAIDEIDSGIFEFLLGEILQLLTEHGRGQLIFTAHNLRPLETIDNSSLVFTTTNPRNRYVRFRGNHATNNLRSQYLRSINLGGQPETIYEPTSRFKMDGAFYDACHPEVG